MRFIQEDFIKRTQAIPIAWIIIEAKNLNLAHIGRFQVVQIDSAQITPCFLIWGWSNNQFKAMR